jgi:hypothetical protein
MRVKAIINCTGEGYKNFKKGEVRNLKKDIAKKLIDFNYAVEVTGDNNSENSEAENTENK